MGENGGDVIIFNNNPVQTKDIPTIGTGYGHSYDLDLVKIMIGLPVTELDDVLDDERRKIFTQTINTSERISTDAPPSKNAYEGSWFYQGLEPTCVPWSIANAIHACGMSPNPSFIAELLNYANDIQESTRQGMSYAEAINILLRYPEEQAEIVRIPYEEQLSRICDALPAETYSKFPNLIIDSRSPEQIAIDADSQNKVIDTKVVIKNGTLIRKVVDSGSVLLTDVIPSKYTKADKGGLHAICVVGYRVSSKGAMDVQVLDSARGKLWMSLEHLSSAIIGLPNYKIVKKRA